MEKRRVFFLGYGYEAIRFVVVEAYTNFDALEKASDWYKTTGQNFDYMCLEVDKYPV